MCPGVIAKHIIGHSVTSQSGNLNIWTKAYFTILPIYIIMVYCYELLAVSHIYSQG